jgi:glucose/arabinose dehydrogenase
LKRLLLASLGLLGLAALPASAQRSEPAPPYTVATVARGLDHPWSLAVLPDGRMLVTERAGRLRIVDGERLSAPVAGVPPVFVRSQGGLFEALPHPRFAENRLVYLSYAHGDRARNATRIARARLDGNRLTDLKVIFEVAPLKDTPVHYGGRMAWLPDGTLVMTTGDGFDFREDAQKKDGLLGKVIRIRDDGSVPPDNPFVGQAGVRPEIYSLGHRNPQGLAYDAASGRLYAHEHGPQGGDEVNLIRAGANYGWPIATKGRDYSGASISPFKTYPGMADGIVVWTPSIAPSGLAIYRGDGFPQWRGDLLVSALVAKEVRRVDLDDAGRVLGQEPLFKELNARIRDVRAGPDGAVYLLTDEADGKLLRVTPIK